MTDSELSKEDAQEIAQLLIDFDSIVEGEWGGGEPETLQKANLLYETFGPFELEFKDHTRTQPPRW